MGCPLSDVSLMFRWRGTSPERKKTWLLVLRLGKNQKIALWQKTEKFYNKSTSFSWNLQHFPEKTKSHTIMIWLSGFKWCFWPSHPKTWHWSSRQVALPRSIQRCGYDDDSWDTGRRSCSEPDPEPAGRKPAVIQTLPTDSVSGLIERLPAR